jgi:ribonuclease HI/exonuclease III
VGQSNRISKDRGNMKRSNFHSLLSKPITPSHTQQVDFLYIQEVNLDKTGTLKTFNQYQNNYHLFYNNLTHNTAGILTLVSKRLSHYYHIEHHNIQEGYITVILLTPKPGWEALDDITLINFYGATNIDACRANPQAWEGYDQFRGSTADTIDRRLLFQMQTIRQFVHKTDTVILGGDFNFVTDHEDRSGKGPLPAKYCLDGWAELLEALELTEVFQPAHTRFGFQDKGKTISTSKLDRFYTNTTNAKNTSTTTTAFIPYIPYGITSTYRHKTILESMRRACTHKATKKNLINLFNNDYKASSIHPSDHEPVALVIGEIAHQHRKNGKNIVPGWVYSMPEFGPRFKEKWEAQNHTDTDFALLLRVKETIVQAGRSLLYQQKTSSKAISDVHKLSICIKLLRITDRVGYRLHHTKPITDHYDFTHRLQLDGSKKDKLAISNYIDQLMGKDIVETARTAEGQLDFAANPYTKDNRVKALGRELPTDKARLTFVKDSECLTAPLVTDPEQITDRVVTFFSKLWEEEYIEEEVVDNYLEDFSKTITQVIAQPTIQNFEEAIEATKNSASGPDSIPFAAWRAISAIAAPVFLQVATALGEGNSPPEGFNHANLFVIPKKGGSRMVKKTRPISVPNTDNRIISTVIKSTITPATIDTVNPNQTALLGRNIGDNVKDFNEFFYSRLEKNQQGYLLFMDFEKAFDSVSHKFIFKVLKKMNYPPWVINSIQGLLQGLGVWTTITGANTQFIKVGRGVKQGCPLSPILYAIILDPLLERLLNVKDNPPNISRADRSLRSRSSGGQTGNAGEGASDSLPSSPNRVYETRPASFDSVSDSLVDDRDDVDNDNSDDIDISDDVDNDSTNSDKTDTYTDDTHTSDSDDDAPQSNGTYAGARGFVDDTGIRFSHINTIHQIIRQTEAHCAAAGGQVNQDKSQLLSTKPFTDKEATVIQASGWPELKMAESAVYLGVVFGRKVQVETVFESALCEFNKRAKKFTALKANFSTMDRIIIANTWLLPMFTYLGQWFTIPDKIISNIFNRLRKFVVPYNLCTPDALCNHRDFCNVKTALREPSFSNVAMLAAGYTNKWQREFMPDFVPASLWRENRDEHPTPPFQASTMRIQQHLIYGFHYARRYDQRVTAGLKPKYIYQLIRNSEEHQIRSRSYIAEKLVYYTHLPSANERKKPDRKYRAGWGLPAGTSAEQDEEQRYEAAQAITDNLSRLPVSTPDHIRWIQTRIVFHGLPTARRIRYLVNEAKGIHPHIDSDTACYFCGENQDYIKELFIDCPIVERAWRETSLANNLPHDPRTHHDLLLTKPFTKQEVEHRVYFNAAVWRARDHIKQYASGAGRYRTIVNIYNDLRGDGGFLYTKIGKEARTTDPTKRNNATARCNNFIATHESSSLMIYTDGGSVGKGSDRKGSAGVYITYQGENYSYNRSLGSATNQVGEVYAMGMAFELITSATELYYITAEDDIHIFSDSEYATNLAAGKWKAQSNLATIKLMRKARKKITNNIIYHWSPGHMGITGNEKADQLATEALSHAHHEHDYHSYISQKNFNHDNTIFGEGAIEPLIHREEVGD